MLAHHKPKLTHKVMFYDGSALPIHMGSHGSSTACPTKLGIVCHVGRVEKTPNPTYELETQPYGYGEMEIKEKGRKFNAARKRLSHMTTAKQPSTVHVIWICKLLSIPPKHMYQNNW